MSATLDLLVTTLIDHFGMEEKTVTGQSRLDELEVDSLAMLEMLTILEDEHGIPLPEDATDIQAHATLEQVAALLEATAAAAVTPAGTSGPRT